MLNRQSPELKEEQRKLMERAVERANWRMRDEVLDLILKSFMERNSVKILPYSAAAMKMTWKPLDLDWNAESGFGMAFMDVSDPMTYEILVNDEIYALVEEIVRESIQEKMVYEGADVFITSLLKDLIGDESFYEQSIR